MFDGKKVKETLRRVEAEIRGGVRETLVAVDRNGAEVCRFSGGEGNVQVSADAIKDNTLTHNHPGGLCFFSTADIESTVNNDGEEIRAVTA